MRFVVPGDDGADDALDGTRGFEPVDSAEAREVIPDDLVDAMLDGEVSDEDASRVLGMIRGDASASARLDCTGRMLRALGSADRSLSCPDFAAQIMTRVAARRGVFSRAGLRRVAGYRYAAAATLVLLIGSMFVAQRLSPETVRLTPQVAPVTDVVRAVPAETAGLFSGMQRAFASLKEAVPAPMPTQLAVRRIERVNREGMCRAWGSEMNPPLAAVLWTDDATTVPQVSTSCQWSDGCSSTRERCLMSLDRPAVERDGTGVVLISFSR